MRKNIVVLYFVNVKLSQKSIGGRLIIKSEIKAVSML